jgi:hypothetical protein
MDERSKEQLALMQTQHPDAKIVLIDWEAYMKLREHYKNLVNWEGK